MRSGLYPRVRYSIFTTRACSSFQLGRGGMYFLYPRLTYFPCAIFYNTIGLLRFEVHVSPFRLITSSSRARCDSLGATRRRFLLSEEGEVMGEQLELGALLKSTLPRLCLVIYFAEFLQRKLVSARNKFTNLQTGSALAPAGRQCHHFTHHHQRLFHAKDGVACKDGIALWEQRRRELVETGSVDHHVQVIRAEVVSSQCQKELTHGTLLFVSVTEDRQHTTHAPQKGREMDKRGRKMKRTSPGMGYETGTMARYPYLPCSSVFSLPRQSGAARSVY